MDMFGKAGLEIGTAPELKIEKAREHYERAYPYDLLDPVQLRKLLLQVYSKKEWKKPQELLKLRKKKVRIDGKERIDGALSVHTMMQIYCVQKYNQEQELRTGKPSYLTLMDFQSNPSLGSFLHSNIEILKEMLDLAGIDYGKAFAPSITDLDLKDPSVLRRLVLNGNVKRLPKTSMEFRKAKFKDPNSGIEINGHTLMLYFSVQDYVNRHPGVSASVAVFDLKLGKSNSSVMKEVYRAARIKI